MPVEVVFDDVTRSLPSQIQAGEVEEMLHVATSSIFFVPRLSVAPEAALSYPLTKSWPGFSKRDLVKDSFVKSTNTSFPAHPPFVRFLRC